jgi:hypothetical protein
MSVFIMLDIFNRGLLFITNITGYTSGKYSWKSYPVQRNSLATDSTPAGGERPPQKETKRPEHPDGGKLEKLLAFLLIYGAKVCRIELRSVNITLWKHILSTIFNYPVGLFGNILCHIPRLR